MASNASKIRDWSSRFKRFRKSNSTVTRFCRDESVTVQAFYYWRDRVPPTIWHAQENQFSGHVSPTALEQSLISTQLTGQPSDGPIVRFTIQAGSITVQCESTSLQAIDLLLKWASDNKATSGNTSTFKQLV